MQYNKKLVEVARGLRPADLVLKGGRVFLAFTGEFIEGDIAIADGRIAGFGSYEGMETVDMRGKFLTPGFIDAHVHIESSMLTPAEFAQAVVPHGTTTIFEDPHEIANVAGLKGIEYMLQASEDIPLNVYFNLPSCVPATSLEHSGAELKAEDLAPLLDDERVCGLAEIMDMSGVLSGQQNVVAKLDMMPDSKRLAGHAPGLEGKELMGYAAAGIQSDHECASAAEGRERLRAGLYVLVREGSAARNLKRLLPIITENNAQFFTFCTDDRHPADLAYDGSINAIVREAVKMGLPIHQALQMATVNPARYFSKHDLGLIAPGARADICVFENLKDWEPVQVYKDGKLVAERGQMLAERTETAWVPDKDICESVRLAPLTLDAFGLVVGGSCANVMELLPGQLLTKRLWQEVKTVDGKAVADTEHDILKLAVFERHHATGSQGLALVKGFGLRRGAIASTVGHDSHNLIVIGASDEDMLLAVEALAECQGGEAIVADGEVLGLLPLPIGGLMTDKPAEETGKRLEAMRELAHELGVSRDYDPFLTLAFLSLPVIPELKLTDMGLVDVTLGRIIAIDEPPVDE